MKRLDWLATRQAAEQYPCPACGAQPGQTCTSRGGGPNYIKPAHYQRIPTQHQERT